MSSSIKSRKTIITIILILIILLQATRIIYIFTNEKDDKHSDEIWAYGLANSTDGPYIFQTNDGLEERYKDEWVDAKVFKDYITVSEDERFNYGNVIYNLKWDTAPPLYCMILHTICSFFPGEYSLWYGFWIGFVCFIVAQFFLFLLAKEVLKDPIYALLAVIFYGFSVGALNVTIFVRHYSMLSMFTVIMLWAHVKLLQANNRKEFLKYLAVASTMTFLGAMTHYFFIVFTFVVGFMYFLWYLLHKNYKKTLCYCIVMMLAVAITIPFSAAGDMLGVTNFREAETAASSTVNAGLFAGIIGLFSNVLNIVYDPLFEDGANIVLSCYLRDFFGIDLVPPIPYIIWNLLYLLLFILLAVILVSILIAKKQINSKNKLIIVLNNFYKRLAGISKVKFFIISAVMASVFEAYVVVGYGRPILMSKWTDRYVSLTYPIFTIGIVLLVKRVSIFVSNKLKNIPRLKYICAAVVVVVAIVINNLTVECIYLFKGKSERLDLYEMAKGKDVILSMSDHWLMTTYLDYLRDSNRILVTDSNAIFHLNDEMVKAEGDEILIVQDVDGYESFFMNKYKIKRKDVSRAMVEEKYLDLYKRAFPNRMIEWIGEDVIFLRNVNFYIVY